MSEELLEAVKKLTGVVHSLEEALKEYPKRAEIERNYTTKAESQKKRRQAVALVTVGGLLSTIIAMFVTVSTVSTCFLGESARAQNAPGICNWLPGYEASQEENSKLLRQFQRLLRTPALNDRRLDRIEKQLGLPPIGEGS